MANQTTGHPTSHTMPAAPVTAPTNARELWGLFRDGIAGGVLVAVLVLGLFSARDAADGLSYDVGLGAAVLAALLLFWLVKHHFDSDEHLLPAFQARTAETLAAQVAALLVLAVLGALLAAHSLPGLAYYVGLSLIWIAVALSFLALKGYFDRRDRG